MNRLHIAITLATLLIALTLGVAVAAAPPLPSSFYGTATIAGQNFPAGTTVAAFIGNASPRQQLYHERPLRLSPRRARR
jgi:hypothetical protein